MTANPPHADTLSLNLELVIHTAAATHPRRHTPSPTHALADTLSRLFLCPLTAMAPSSHTDVSGPRSAAQLTLKSERQV